MSLIRNIDLLSTRCFTIDGNKNFTALVARALQAQDLVVPFVEIDPQLLLWRLTPLFGQHNIFKLDHPAKVSASVQNSNVASSIEQVLRNRLDQAVNFIPGNLPYYQEFIVILPKSVIIVLGDDESWLISSSPLRRKMVACLKDLIGISRENSLYFDSSGIFKDFFECIELDDE